MDRGNRVPVGMLPGGITTAGLLVQLDLPLQPPSPSPPPPPPPPPPQHQSHRQQARRQMFQQQQQRAMPPFQQALANDGDLGQMQLQMRHESYSTSVAAPFIEPQPQQKPMNSEDQHPTVFGEAAAAATEGGDTASKRGYAFQQTLAISPSRSASLSPWHRMKWTDSMVRLLISVVYRVGDDGEQQTCHASSAKSTKKSSASASALLQKKGKWKSVSQAMMEKGFYVSPQQCEDKFNDLNKRYKRVTDLLGKGTACRVVENQALLDTMDYLAPKAKEEARKLLNSKHLFFPEMCAYHNAGGGGGASSSHGTTPPPPQMLFQTFKADQQHCFHHLQASQGESAAAAAAGKVGAEEDTIDDDDDDDLDSEEDGDYDGEDDDEDEEEHDNLSHREQHHQHKHREADQEDEDNKGVVKKAKAASSTQHLLCTATSPSPPLSSSSSAMQQLRGELTEMSDAGGEQQRQRRRQWLRKRAAELEEQRVGYQGRAFQLEQQRFKWLRYSTNKERQMERMKLENDRLRLENDRMLLLLRQKELELVYVANGGSNGAARYPSAAEQ